MHDFEFKAEEDNGNARIEYDSMISEAENELQSLTQEKKNCMIILKRDYTARRSF